jgi:fibronectin-binding autotransporter adhesin
MTGNRRETTRRLQALMAGASVIAILLAASAGTASAQTVKTWTGGSTGNWAVDANWDPSGMPTQTNNVVIVGADVSYDLADGTVNQFRLDGQTRLTLQGGDVLLLGGGSSTVGFDSQGELVVTGPGTVLRGHIATAGSITVGLTSTSTGHFTVSNGASSTLSFLRIGDVGTGELLVTGTDSILSARTLNVGFSGNGTVRVEDGGQLVSVLTSLLADSSSSGSASIEISGDGSTWTANSVVVGSRNAATILIEESGQLNANWMALGARAGASGTVSVSGGDSVLSVSDDMFIGFGTDASHGTGTVTLSDGGILRARDLNDDLFEINLGLFANSIGTINVGSGSGAGTVQASEIRFGDGTGALNFNHTNGDYEFDADLTSTGSGTHTVNHLAGTTTLSGNSSLFTGTTTVSGGTLNVTGTLGGAVSVTSGGTLGGSGTVGGVTVASGGILAPGTSPGTITMDSLVLNAGSVLNFELGDPDGTAGVDSDLIVVTGDLTLDGMLSVSPLSGFGNGLYTLIQYGNLVANNDLEPGTLPLGYTYDVSVGTVVANAVTLTVSGGAAGDNQFWDGPNTTPGNVAGGHGGDGVWNASNTNWTDQGGNVNDAWGGQFAIFGGTAGTVTIEGPQMFTGMQFLTTGYELAGASGELVTDTAETNVRVGSDRTATVNARISGSGGLVKQEAGTLVLGGDNSYSGGTQIRGGILFVESNTALGTGAVVVEGTGARLYFGNATPGISAGSLTITNRSQGATSFQAGSTAGTATITSETGSFVAFVGDSTAGSATLISNGGSTQFSGNSNAGGATITSDINGSIRFFGDSRAGTAEIENDGLLRFDGDSSADAAEITSNLTLVFADTSTAGNANIANTRTMVFSGASTAGNAEIINSDGLTFQDLSTIGTAAIVNTGNLFFSQFGNDSYAGDLSGTGAVFKSGAGALTLTGNNSYTGATTVSGGALNIMGSLVSTVTVEGGTLAGTGTIGGLILDSGGTLSPGNSIGTLTVTGDTTFNAGSVYIVEVEAPDQADLLSVTGAATINGGTVQVTKLSAEASYLDGQTYRIIEAGTVVNNGGFTFANPFLFLSSDLEYGATYVDIVLTAGAPGQDFTTVAQAFNQFQSATGLNDLEQSGDALAVYNELLLMTDADEARRAFELASGEVYASAHHVVGQSHGLFARTLQGQARVGLASLGKGGRVGVAPLGYSTVDLPTSLPSGLLAADSPDLPLDAYANTRVRAAWLAPVGARGTVGGDGNAAALDWWTLGFAGGYEGTLDVARGEAHAGFAFGYMRGHGAIDDRLSELDSDGLHLGAYGAWADGPWSLSGSFAYAASRLSTERRIVIGGLDRTAQADYWTHTIGLSAETAYRFDFAGGIPVSPLATLDVGWSGHGGFTETGAEALNLSSGSASHGWFDAGLGLAVAHTTVTADGGRLTLEGRAVWEHAFADVVPDQSLSFAGSPTGFTVSGPDAGRDRLRLGLGATYTTGGNLEFHARYDGTFSGSQHSHGASLGLAVKF